MSETLHARYYADQALHRRLEVEANWQVARDTFRLRFPTAEIAERIVPGQFVMVRLADCDDPLIGRALALYEVICDSVGRPRAIDLVYAVKGRLTTRLARLSRGQYVDVWGPLGNGFEPVACDHLVIAAGGIGQTPFVALAREALGAAGYGMNRRTAGYARKVTVIYGVRTADLIAGADDFRAAGAELLTCTDDGSGGRRGRVPDVLAEVLESCQPDQSVRVVTCGPEIMMQRVTEVAARHGVPCQVSLETPMACGIGICFSCVAAIRDSQGGWDYKRTCVEGPVFDAEQIAWPPHGDPGEAGSANEKTAT